MECLNSSSSFKIWTMTLCFIEKMGTSRRTYFLIRISKMSHKAQITTIVFTPHDMSCVCCVVCRGRIASLTASTPAASRSTPAQRWRRSRRSCMYVCSFVTVEHTKWWEYETAIVSFQENISSKNLVILLNNVLKTAKKKLNSSLWREFKLEL